MATLSRRRPYCEATGLSHRECPRVPALCPIRPTFVTYALGPSSPPVRICLRNPQCCRLWSASEAQPWDFLSDSGFCSSVAPTADARTGLPLKALVRNTTRGHFGPFLV